MANLAGTQKTYQEHHTRRTDRKYTRYTETSPKNPKTHRAVPARGKKGPVLQLHQMNCHWKAEIQQKKQAIFAWTTSQIKHSLRLHFDDSLAYSSVIILIFRYLEMYDLLDPFMASLIPNKMYFS